MCIVLVLVLLCSGFLNEGSKRTSKMKKLLYSAEVAFLAEETQAVCTCILLIC